MANKKYWQNFSELSQTEQAKTMAENEFQEDLPFESADKSSGEGPSRRDFLKYLGFSTAAASLAASCEIPVNKSIPFLNRPQDVVPGVADFYATTFVSGSDVLPVLAKVRDGRPIKIEGNNLSTYTNGGTSARAQASVLDLYDSTRLRFPIANGNPISVEDADKLIATAMGTIGGAPVVLLTSTITSPSSRQVISEFLAKYPGSRHVQYDAISYSGLLLANEASYGKRAIPAYRFDNAKVVVSLGADFLGTWLSPVEFQRSFAQTRKVSAANPSMSRHYQFESMMSVTGGNADFRYTHKPSETGAVALALLNAINGQAVSGVPEKVKRGIEKAAADLKGNAGSALVVSGSNNPNVQIIVNAINEALGANGKTIDWTATLQTHQGIDTEFATLVADLEGGRVGALLVYDVNPVYDYVDGKRVAEAIKKVKVTISFNDRRDETSEVCKFIIPSHHYLESWGDAEPKAGYFSMMQPTISPLFKTRQFQESLLKWSGNATPYATYFKNFWTTRLGSADTYAKALQDGVIEPANPSPGTAGFNGGAVGAATSAISSMKKGGKTELVLYQHIGLGDGRQGNNPWLLELPDPITRATWDNFAMISVQMGKELLGIDISNPRDSDKYEVHMTKPVLTIKSGNKEISLPALIVPGMNENTIAIAVGYGRKSLNEEDTAKNIGRAAAGAGKNAFHLASFNGTTIDLFAGDVSVTKTTEIYTVAQTQTHASYEGRHEVVKELTFDEYKKDPTAVLDERAKELEPWGGLESFTSEGTLYGVYDRPGIKWGMSIDLNSCFGCGACVVACNAENNIPVVGKSEVTRFHDMHWLRIDRYFSGDVNDPESVQTVFQPMLCQHCDNAPCENVCPVAATNHNSEGINQMIYNRCIGTRYCANNCPYKVRRFNWADYTGADSFKDNQLTEGIGKLDPVVFQMNDDLTRMVLNPDVTVRSRGVIEKCSFCVQRVQAGKLQAKKEDRVLTDADVTTACAQACPTNAIVFGNVNNPQSNISKTRSDNKNRLYYVLEQIHTLPNVNYLAKVRNNDILTAAHPTEDELSQPEKKVETHFSE
jgi:molybdopterin-containing oxidoreductase family iron-sulfur binding subunit